MCIRTTLRLAALLALATAFPALASATTILSDDFNDNSLDATKWTTYTAVAGTSKVVEADGRLAITDRGYLVTKNTYDPDDYAGGITITGQWTPGSADDHLIVDTRANITHSASASGLISDGLVFLGYNSGTMQIRAYSGGSRLDATYLNTATTTGALAISAGTTYNFTIVDNGATSLSFTMTQADNASNTKTVTSSLKAGMDPATLTGNHISFANKEVPSHTCSYDNIMVTTIPEPSTIVLFVTGLIGLLVYAWRKHR